MQSAVTIIRRFGLSPRDLFGQAAIQFSESDHVVTPAVFVEVGRLRELVASSLEAICVPLSEALPAMWSLDIIGRGVKKGAEILHVLVSIVELACVIAKQHEVVGWATNIQVDVPIAEEPDYQASHIRAAISSPSEAEGGPTTLANTQTMALALQTLKSVMADDNDPDAWDFSQMMVSNVLRMLSKMTWMDRIGAVPPSPPPASLRQPVVGTLMVSYDSATWESRFIRSTPETIVAAWAKRFPKEDSDEDDDSEDDSEDSDDSDTGV
jgi:hypothetical protein